MIHLQTPVYSYKLIVPEKNVKVNRFKLLVKLR